MNALDSSDESTKRGLPPFGVRNSQSISNNLKTKAIVEGFVNKPIYTYLYLPNQWLDDLSPKTCKYVYDSDRKYEYMDESYSDILYLRDKLAGPISKSFDIPR